MTQPNSIAGFLRLQDVGSVSAESVLASAFDSWGVSEGLLLDLISRNPLSDDALPLFAGNKTAERILAGYIQNHFQDWFRLCWQPMIDKLLVEPERYAVGKPAGLRLVFEGTCCGFSVFAFSPDFRK